MSDNELEDMTENVFLTGATGALGPILAAELLSSGAASRLRVLIRGGDSPALARFNQWIGTLESVLAASGSLLPNPRKRVGLIEGDLSAPDLAIHSAQQAEFFDETEVIVHGAADTNFRGQAHWETNVEGTRRILELARKCRRLKKLVHVSTICVAGIQTGVVREAPVLTEPKFANAYERTKWEAERFVLESDLPVEIVRVGIVMGSSITGEVHRLGALHHVFRWFGTGQMPVVPGQPTTPVDLIDSELAAKVIRKVAQSPSTPGAIYHAAAGKRAVLLRDLCRFCSQQMHDEILESQFRTLDDREPHSRAHERLAKAWLPVLLASRTYDTARAEALWGGPLPLADWRQTLAKVLRSCGYVAQQRASVG
jgi:nucleoside-diphosphate-sugar epimerase